MVGHRSSFVTIFLWISLLSSSLYEAWSRPKEAFPFRPRRNEVAASSLNFMVVGDWGGQDDPPYYTDPEQDVAKQMGDIAASMGAQFTLSMGDNFYDNGVTDVDDPRFKDTFEDVFKADSLQSRWYIVCGNHDHYGNCSAEIAYTKQSNRWYFPDYYYSEGLTIHVFSSPDGPDSQQAADDEWEWIDQTLAGYSKPSSRVGWIFVAGHYPVWSVGHHGPTNVLVEKLNPMLVKYKVAAYFSGHDHDMQHLNDSGVQYFLSGAGHLVESSQKHKDDVPKDSLKFFYGPDDDSDSKGGFTTVSVGTDTMNITFYNYKGHNKYQVTVSRPT